VDIHLRQGSAAETRLVEQHYEIRLHWSSVPDAAGKWPDRRVSGTMEHR
jgi:hypothetical protein